MIQFLGPQLKTVAPKIGATKRKSVGLVFTKRKFNVLLGINTGMLGCIIKLPDEVCVSNKKRVEENKAVLQL